MWKQITPDTYTKSVTNAKLVEKGLTHFTIERVRVGLDTHYNLFVTSRQDGKVEIASGIEGVVRAQILAAEFEEDWERDIQQWYFFKMVILTLLVIALVLGLTLSPSP